MPTITLSVPEELKKEMDKSRDINWSEVARRAIRERVENQKLFEKIVKKSKLTEKDAKEIGDSINRGMAKHFMDEANRRRKHSNSGINKK